MVVEEEVKKLILSRYKSLRAFATEIEMPHTTLDSIFRRGFLNAGIVNMVKICKALDIDTEELAQGKITQKNKTNQIKQRKTLFSRFNDNELSQDELEEIRVISDYLKMKRKNEE